MFSEFFLLGRDVIMRINDILDFIIRCVYPRRCVFCDEILEIDDKNYVCEKCSSETEWISGKVCEKCGMPINYFGMCIRCKKTKRHFDTAYSVYRYEGKVRRSIHRLKYNKRGSYARFYGKEMAHFADLENIPYVDYVVPVPISKSRLRKRGYNQCELLARAYCKARKQVYLDILKRTKRTKPQNKLNLDQRKSNVKGAFKIKDTKFDLHNKSFLIIDDIFTTGSTADECAKILKNAGAKEVYVFCLSISVLE